MVTKDIINISKAAKIDAGMLKSVTKKTKLKVWTQVDEKTHTYFNEFNYDADVKEFMSTADLTCPYHNDLMQYWEPIATEVAVYGSNGGDYKLLYIGRVREVKQDGYNLVISMQSYAWKFEQLASGTFVQDNIIGKDGATIIKTILEALKLDSYVMDASAEYYLQQVTYNENGELVIGQESVEQIPDMYERVKLFKPDEALTKNLLANKLKEDKIGNLKNINFTLKYEEPTPVMKKIQSENVSNTTSGAVIYGTNSVATNTTAIGTREQLQGTGVTYRECITPTRYIKMTKRNINQTTINKALCEFSQHMRTGKGMSAANKKVLVDLLTPKKDSQVWSQLRTIVKVQKDVATRNTRSQILGLGVIKG